MSDRPSSVAADAIGIVKLVADIYRSYKMTNGRDPTPEEIIDIGEARIASEVRNLQLLGQHRQLTRDNPQ